MSWRPSRGTVAKKSWRSSTTSSSATKKPSTLVWLDKTTRDGAIKKLKGISKLIAYSTLAPDVVSAKSLDEYYKDYVVSTTDYIDNQFRYAAWAAAVDFSELPKPVNKNRIFMIPVTVNAYYMQDINTIGFPAGTLQSPFFSIENPEYINYRSMGATGSHEIRWWTNATPQEFEQKFECFIDQYGNFTVKGPDSTENYVDGWMTLGENLADHYSIKMAFRIWQSRLKSDPGGRKYNNFKLPGLDKYTPEQLFFISYGRLWCSKETPKWTVEMLKFDPHSLNQWRIKGVVRNSSGFAKVFKCPVGSPMNLVKKCEVW
ncbi:hypothetical protein BGZ47_000662 [Haplosporangium gracile]|nr:hypothetical protein BGZ47_000662 [Haplosporangium gracile]